MSLEEDRQECQSLITPERISTLQCVLQGSINANAQLQSAFMSAMPDALKVQSVLCVEDMVLGCKTIDKLLQ